MGTGSGGGGGGVLINAGVSYFNNIEKTAPSCFDAHEPQHGFVTSSLGGFTEF